MDTVKIYFPGPLGDILFCQKIAHKLIEQNFKVHWPNNYPWLANHIKINNLFWSEPAGPHLVLDLQHSIEKNHPYDVMTCKYETISYMSQCFPEQIHKIDWIDWDKYLIFERNRESEDNLYYKILGLNDDEEYVFLNEYYSNTILHTGVDSNIVNKKLKVVRLGIFGGYSLFDWSKVIENATEIHTVDTSLLYLIEVLNIKTKILKLYPRHPEHTFKCLNKLFKTNWTWM
jgi:hypothetical protein